MIRKNKDKLILPCIRGIVGDWVYYLSTMNSSQISNWVEPSKNIKEAKSLNDYLQRTLKKREKEIASYLIENKHRFFNSILIGVYGGLPDWIEFDIVKTGKKLSIDMDTIKNTMGLLIFKGNESMFAIDGQHRVKGIDKAIELTNLHGNSSGVHSDYYPIIFLAHIDNSAGKIRTRRLFSDINRKAKPIPKKDFVIIDEEDISAIVARKIYANNKYFKKGLLIDIESDTSNLDKDDINNFTNLVTLHTIIKRLSVLYNKDKTKKDWHEKNVNSLYKVSSNFFDFIFMHINHYKDYFVNNSLSLKEARINNSYLLFRPIGLILIARLYVHFTKSENLSIFKDNINKISFILPKSPLNKILWNNGIMEAASKNQTLAYNLCLYLLGEKTPRKSIEDIVSDLRFITKNDNAKLPKKIKIN